MIPPDITDPAIVSTPDLLGTAIAETAATLRAENDSAIAVRVMMDPR
ncbi:hypothetical protein [Gordonia rubripertincta]|uniref:Uncharacterized protein n=1 Tax=Gordonia rubripertincta TaxID=36822 RepID=A0ABT4MZ07_GORRU|nr:hypothetical protein [Gordonia rubripertincta]MCZ4552244.1 hypothetical protein [Gordonia rubripertincta]